MTLTSAIITDAYRESNLLAIGASPTDAQVTEALRRLNVLVAGVYGFEVGDPLVDWPLGQYGITPEDQTWWRADLWQYPPINTRLIVADEAAQTVYLHPNPSNGARVGIIDPAGLLAGAPVTLDGNGRRIEGQATLLLDENNTSKLWFYRAETGSWTLLSTLEGTVAEEFPFPMEFDDYFITSLAMRLNPRYGRSVSEESAVALASTLEKLRARYYQRTVTLGDPALARLSQNYGDMRRYSGGNGDSGSASRVRRSLTPPFYHG